jgi:hypothetical protein
MEGAEMNLARGLVSPNYECAVRPIHHLAT